MKKDYKSWLQVKRNELLYKLVKTCPNLVYFEYSLSTIINHATVTDIVKVNKDIHQAQQQNDLNKQTLTSSKHNHYSCSVMHLMKISHMVGHKELDLIWGRWHSETLYIEDDIVRPFSICFQDSLIKNDSVLFIIYFV